MTQNAWSDVPGQADPALMEQLLAIAKSPTTLAAQALSAAIAKGLGKGRQNGFMLPYTRAAMAAYRAGTRNARVLCAGDSTVRGTYTNGSATGPNDATSFPARLAYWLQQMGRNSTYLNICGASNLNAAQFLTWYPGASIGGSWALDGSFGVPGYQAFRHQSTTADVLTLPIAGVFDTIVVTSIKASGYGSATVGVDGGSTQYGTVNFANASPVVANDIITVPLAAHTSINITKVASGGATQAIIVKVSAYNSTTKTVEVYNTGWGGSKASDWSVNSNVWNPSNTTAVTSMLANYAPDLTIIDLGINDWINGTAPATFLSNLTTFAAACAQFGDVIIITPPPSSTSVTAAATQQAIVQQIRALCQQQGYGLVDIFATFGPYTLAQAGGLFLPANDTVHPGTTGADLIAQALASVFPVTL